MRGAEALSDVQMNGIKVDVTYCKKAFMDLQKEVKSLKEELMSYDEIRRWKHKYGKGFSFQSNKQLADILYNELGYEVIILTDGEEPSTSQEALELTGAAFVPALIKYNQTTKVKDTYIKGILREVVDGRIHPFFNSNIAQTYRSAGESPNFQNMPIRNPVMGSIVRKAIIADKNSHLVEVDYSRIEVMGSAWHHQDPNMLAYLADPSSDMHSDTAMEIYKMTHLDKSTCEKDIRKVSKNSFVFPEFYGDYWRSCAAQLWNDIHKYKLKLKDGTPIKTHLKKHGIKNYKQFEVHIKNIEDHFWSNRFPVYNQWRKDRVESYNKLGYGDSLFGFRFQGVMPKNRIFNYPIQCDAYQCLLWSLTRINDILKKEKWKSKIVGQIHDSIVAEVHTKELDDYLKLVNNVMCHEIREANPFIITHLEIEADVTPKGGSWNDKKEYKLTA